MTNEAPLLTIVTRVCDRPRMLTLNVMSVRAQTDSDIEQVFYVDDKRRGRLWANRELNEHHDRIAGQYVFILDDDCRLTHPRFVERLRRIIEQKHLPQVVMVKSRRPQLRPNILPRTWQNEKKLRGKHANCLCYVVERRLWVQNIDAFGTGTSGAGRFLQRLLNLGVTIAWLDLVASETMQLGRDARFERVRRGWWKRFAQEQRIVNFGDGDWRLCHWV